MERGFELCLRDGLPLAETLCYKKICFLREFVSFWWNCVWIYEGQQRSWWFCNEIVKMHKHVLPTVWSHQSSHLSWKWSVTIAITSAKSHNFYFWFLSWMATVKGIPSILFQNKHKNYIFFKKVNIFDILCHYRLTATI